MWHICGSHAGPGVPGTVPLMKGQGTWLSGTSQMPSASTHPGVPGASTVASELQSEQVSEHLFLSFPRVRFLTDLPWTEVVGGFFFILILKAKVAR